jgi:P-type Cu+ transporter
MTKDPICGMNVNPEAAAFSIHYRGQTYYFCSQMCRMMFEYEPEKYVKVEGKEAIERKP